MAFGAGRFWGDDGSTGPVEEWDPWPLASIWRQVGGRLGALGRQAKAEEVSAPQEEGLCEAVEREERRERPGVALTYVINLI